MEQLKPGLTRKLLTLSLHKHSTTRTIIYHSGTKAPDKQQQQQHQPQVQIDKDALDAASELIRQFIIETHQRASIEAEVENNMSIGNMLSNRNRKNKKRKQHHNNDEEEENATRTINKSNSSTDEEEESLSKRNKKENKVLCKHVMKVSAGILMDFS